MATLQLCVGLYFLKLGIADRGTSGATKLLALSCLTTYALVGGLRSATSRWPVLARVTGFSLALLYITLWAFQYKTRHLLDFATLAENRAELFAPEALRMYAAALGWPSVLCLGAVLLAFMLWELTTGTLLETQRRSSTEESLLLALGFAAVWAGGKSIDPVGKLLRGATMYFTPAERLSADDTGDGYPYYHATADAPSKGPRTLPHVFLVQIEAFNANFVDARTPEGDEYTPFFNGISRQGLSIEKFYGTSIQTSRGQFALHCGLPGSYRGKVFVDYAETAFHCLPAILHESGYRTLFFKAFNDVSFDNSGPFMLRNGFDVARGMDASFIKPEDRPYIWGWGLQDNVFYRKFFAYLDEDERREATEGHEARYFASLHTVSSHMRFDLIPWSQRHLYRSPKSPKEQYANAINLADRYLGEFFSQLHSRPYLKDSIVIVVGDHSFPAGEHGNYANDVGYYDESFRTPFVVIWPGKITPKRVTDLAYSQLDVAPTVLDLIGVTAANHFVGVSMLRETSEQHSIPIYQPYDGVYLGSVYYPYKFVKHIETGEEFLYDLGADPTEAHNLVRDARNASEASRGRRDTAALQLHQQLIERDRIWPKHAAVVGEGGRTDGGDALTEPLLKRAGFDYGP